MVDYPAITLTIDDRPYDLRVLRAGGDIDQNLDSRHFKGMMTLAMMTTPPHDMSMMYYALVDFVSNGSSFIVNREGYPLHLNSFDVRYKLTDDELAIEGVKAILSVTYRSWM